MAMPFKWMVYLFGYELIDGICGVKSLKKFKEGLSHDEIEIVKVFLYEAASKRTNAECRKFASWIYDIELNNHIYQFKHPLEGYKKIAKLFDEL